MKKLTTLIGIALLTFVIGIGVQSFRNPSPTKAIISATPAELTKTPTEQPPPQAPPQPPPSRVEEVGDKENSDLSIVFDNRDSGGSVIQHIKLNKNRSAVIDLDLAESIYDHEVSLNFPDNSANYRILQRYRTSMTVSVEGPHLDLMDWRHFDSPWIPLKSIGSKRFRMLASEQMEETMFPPTTRSEMVKEVRRRVEKEWPEVVELVKSCRGPNDGACIVAISSMYLRIQKQVGGTWTNIGSVEFQIPMGC